MLFYIALAFLAILYLPNLLMQAASKARQFWMIRNLPGPKRFFFIGTFFDMVENSYIGLKFMLEECQKLQAQGEKIMNFVCFGRVLTFPLDSDTLKPLVDSTEEIVKGHDYDFLYHWLETGLLVSTGEKWRSRRKLLTPIFHFSMLQGYIATMDRQAKNLADLLVERFSNKEVDLYPYAKLVTLDIICETAMCCKLDAVRNPDQPYVNSVQEYVQWAQRNSIEFWMWFAPTWYLFYHRSFSNLLHRLKSFTMNVIKERQQQRKDGVIKFVEGDGKHKAFLDILLEHHEKGELTLEDIREEVDNFMFAGHDTTSASIAWLLWCLATNPQYQARVQEELDEIFGNDQERACTPEDTKNMVYLEMCHKEQMRIFSSVPIVERKLKHDFHFGEHVIPKDSEIFISSLVLHHNPAVYPNDWVYDPDRFLPDKVAERKSLDFIPFSAGPRNCIGQKFAYLEVKLIVSWILRRFTIYTDKPMLGNIYMPEVIMRPNDGVVVKLIPRKPNSTARPSASA